MPHSTVEWATLVALFFPANPALRGTLFHILVRDYPKSKKVLDKIIEICINRNNVSSLCKRYFLTIHLFPNEGVTLLLGE